MPTKIIVSYDGTDNDRDALALGRLLGDAGAEVSLAYVVHTDASERRERELADEDAEQLLREGAQRIGRPDASRHVIHDASTAQGLRKLAAEQQADVIVFGSDYHTATGHVSPGNAAQRLIDGGPASIALAPAGLRDRGDHTVARVGLVNTDGDPAATETADVLSQRLHAATTPEAGSADLVVVGSRADATPGQVRISAATEYLIETTSAPVLIVRRGVPVRFDAPVSVTA